MIASVLKFSGLDTDERLIAGISTLKEVDPVSTVTRVVTVTNVPISVFMVRICDPEKCRIGPPPCMVYCQGKLMETNYGRDHHFRCFSIWMAGGGIKPGIIYDETDDYSYNVVADPVHVHDIQATILYCLGIDHKRLTFKFQGATSV